LGLGKKSRLFLQHLEFHAAVQFTSILLVVVAVIAVGLYLAGVGLGHRKRPQVSLDDYSWLGKPRPLAPAELAMKTDHAASAYMRGFIENNADMGVIVRTNDNLDDTQKEQLLAALRNRKNGCGTADRPLLLWNSCEIVKPTVSSADLQFIENRKFSRSEICAALGVPEEIVSTTDHNKYDVMQGARLNFIENRVAPLCDRLEASERRVVQAIDPNAIGWFDIDSLRSCSRPGAPVSVPPKSVSTWAFPSTNSTAPSTWVSNACPTVTPVTCRKTSNPSACFPSRHPDPNPYRTGIQNLPAL